MDINFYFEVSTTYRILADIYACQVDTSQDRNKIEGFEVIYLPSYYFIWIEYYLIYMRVLEVAKTTYVQYTK